MTSRLFLPWVLASLVLLVGCESKPKESEKPADQASKSESSAPKTAPPGHSGDVIELGETTVGGMKVKASRDKGDIKAGGDSPIDIWLNGGLGDAAAVRFWIGTEDAKGSVKAKADVEAAHWHTHAEVPNPLPAGTKLWVEIEGKDGKKSLTSFDLKQ